MFKENPASLLLEICKNNINKIFIALILVFIVSILESVSAFLVAPLMSAISDIPFDNTQIPPLFSKIVLIYNELSYENRIFSVGLAIVFVALIKNFVAYILGIVFYEFEMKSGQQLRLKCANRLVKLDINYHDRVQIGKALSYLNDHPQRCQLLLNSLIQFLRDGLIVAFLIGILFTISVWLTIITIILFSLLALVLRLSLNKVRYFSKEASDWLENYLAVIAEIVQGIRVIKAFNAEDLELKRLESTLDRKIQADIKAYSYTIIPPPLTETLGTGIMLFVLISGAVLLKSSSNLSLPLLLTYTFTLFRLLPRLVQINNLRSQYSLYASSLEAIFLFLKTTQPLEESNAGLLYETSKKDINISLKNIEFSFPNELKPVLNNINFDILQGSTTALVGSSGSGKSTLVNLIMRFYQPNKGKILVNGKNLNTYSVGSWRKRIAIVQQDTFLFNASVLENIAYGNVGATEAMITEASQKAYAYDFIQELPKKFDTVLGNRGFLLSGGQRQRIAIARAILCDPDILILDEATSALDSTSERIVQQAIEEVSRDRTVIVIAHRLSTIEKADKIVVMHEGRVVEQGTHQELLALQGRYWSLHQSQVASTTGSK